MKFSFLVLLSALACMAQAQSPLLLPVTVGGKQGYIDTAGSIVIPPQFDIANGFGKSGYASVKKEGFYYIINRTGALVSPQAFDDYFIHETWDGVTLLRTSKNGKYGLADENFREVIPFIYDKIERFKNGIAIAIKEGKTGYLDFNGNFTDLSNYTHLHNMSEGFLSLRKKGRADEMWIYNTLSRQIESGPYSFLNESNRFFNGKVILYLRNGRTVIANSHGEAIITPPGNYYITDPLYTDSIYPIKVLHPESDRKVGIMDNQGRIILDPDKKYYDIHFFEPWDGRLVAVFEVRTGQGKISKGIMNARGEIIVQACYEDLRIYNEDYLVIKRNGNWGITNWEGKELVPAIYEDIDFWGDDFIRVTTGTDNDEKQGYINLKSGAFIWKPTYRWRTD